MKNDTLLENISLAENLPFTLDFSNLAEEDFHHHKEMEVILILQGSAKCKIHNVLYELNKGDVLIIDTQDLHRIYGTSKDVLMLDMYVDLSYFEDLYPDIEYMIFACEDYSKASSMKHQDLQRKLSILKHHIVQTALNFFKERDNHDLLLSSIDDLIFNLVNQFQGFFIEDYKFKADQSNPEDVDLARLYKIIKYIYLNYDKKITLDDLSQILYLSPFYISHLIKNTSGLSFQNFLNYVRLEYAEKMLAENRLNLTEISNACGFSSLSYFNKCFKTWYNMTPSQYRQQILPGARRHHGDYSKDAAVALLKEYIISAGVQGSEKQTSQYSHHIFIPVKHSFRSGPSFNKAFPLNITLSDQDDVLMLHRYSDEIKALKPETILLDCGNLFGEKNIRDATGLLNMLLSTGHIFLTYNETTCNNAPVKTMLDSAGIHSVHKPVAMQSKSLLIGDHEKNTPNENCSAFKAYASIVGLPKQTISLTGSGRALFTLEGLPTPYYQIYSIFNEVEGVITEQREQYMIVKNDKNIYLIIHQGDEKSKLKTHIRVSGLLGKLTIFERKLEQKHSPSAIINSQGSDFILSSQGFSYAKEFSQGSVNLYSLNADDSLDLDYDLDPGSLIYIRIFSD